MKYLILIVLLGTCTINLAQEEEYTLDWLTNLEEAQRVSKKSKKPILVYFTGSDWCAPCKMLKKDFFEHPEFIEKSESFVLVMIDYPRRVDIISEEQMAYNKGVVAKLNKSRTFPKILILNSKGKKKDEISGYSPLRDTSSHFNFIARNI